MNSQMMSGVSTLSVSRDHWMKAVVSIILLFLCIIVSKIQPCYLMVCPYYLLDQQIDNLALHVFQRYYDELCQALNSCLKEVATVLYRKELVTSQERSQAVDAQGLTPFQKADVLMQAVKRRIASENSASPLRNFCRVLQRHHGVGNIVSRMRSRLGD